MADTPSGNVVVGNPVTLATSYMVEGVPTAPSGAVTCQVVDPLGTSNTYTTEIINPSTGVFQLSIITTVKGLWHWYWQIAGQAADQGSFTVEDEFDQVIGSPSLTDLAVLVPRSRRICEGPFGPAPKPPLEDEQLYEMAADACANIILYTGTMFNHKLLVTQRDPLKGFPTGWATDAVLDEWECALLATEVGLNYHFFYLRDMRTSETLKNEGTEWTYSISANVLGSYLKELQTRRDMALEGLRRHNPILDRFASNIRVRDQATVALLEWWDTVSVGAGGAQGMPGGQEAAVIPWTPGWSGPGWTP